MMKINLTPKERKYINEEIRKYVINNVDIISIKVKELNSLVDDINNALANLEDIGIKKEKKKFTKEETRAVNKFFGTKIDDLNDLGNSKIKYGNVRVVKTPKRKTRKKVFSSKTLKRALG